MGNGPRLIARKRPITRKAIAQNGVGDAPVHMVLAPAIQLQEATMVKGNVGPPQSAPAG